MIEESKKFNASVMYRRPLLRTVLWTFFITFSFQQRCFQLSFVKENKTNSASPNWPIITHMTNRYTNHFSKRGTEACYQVMISLLIGWESGATFFSTNHKLLQSRNYSWNPTTILSLDEFIFSGTWMKILKTVNWEVILRVLQIQWKLSQRTLS